MSYIETSLEQMLLDNVDISMESMAISIKNLIKKTNKQSSSPIIGISETEFQEKYKAILISEFNKVYPKLNQILRNPKYKKVKKAYTVVTKAETEDHIQTLTHNLSSCMSYEGQVYMPLIYWDLYSVFKNPRDYTPEQEEFWNLYKSITDEITNILSDKKLFFIDDGGDWDEGVITLILNKKIIKSVIESHLMIDTPKVNTGDPGFYLNGTYYSIRWINKEPYRDRVETLITRNGNELYVRLLENNPQFPYTIPGGGLDLDSIPIKQAENEINEEALMSVKNIQATGINFVTTYKDDSKSKFRHIPNFPIRYRGAFTELFIAEYDKPYKGHIDEKDLDPKMVKEGKFISIIELKDILSDKHKEALINSSLVDDRTKMGLMLSQVNESTIDNSKTCHNLYMDKCRELDEKIQLNNEDLESNIYNHKVRFMELEKFVNEYQNREEYSQLRYLFILHLNKQISRVRFTYKSNHDDEIKKLWLEFDQWLMEVKTKVINNINLEQTVETTHSIMTSNKLYYLSENNLDQRVLLPKQSEKQKPSIEFCSDIKSLLETGTFMSGKTYNVHEPQRKPINILTEGNYTSVYDPTKVKCIGKLIVTEGNLWKWLEAPEGAQELILESSNSISDYQIVMEADPLDEEDEATDYTEDENLEDETEPTEDNQETNAEEEEVDVDQPEEDDIDVDEEPTDYTMEDDEENQDEPGEEMTVDGTETEDENLEDEPTDYTDETDEETIDDTEGGEQEETTDEEVVDETEEEDNNGDIVSKNKFLLKDFNKLFSMVDDIINNLESTVFMDPVQNSGLAQVIKNLNKIKDFVIDYIENHFNLTDYTANLYYYNIAIQSLKINYTMLDKVRELDSNNKQIDKKQ